MKNKQAFLNREIVERVRKMYPKGTQVELVWMDDPYTRLTPGEKGIVRLVDDTATVFVDWASGSSLGIVYGVDQIRKL